MLTNEVYLSDPYPTEILDAVVKNRIESTYERTARRIKPASKQTEAIVIKCSLSDKPSHKEKSTKE